MKKMDSKKNIKKFIINYKNYILRENKLLYDVLFKTKENEEIIEKIMEEIYLKLPSDKKEKTINNLNKGKGISPFDFKNLQLQLFQKK
jgi:hypothetical protein